MTARNFHTLVFSLSLWLDARYIDLPPNPSVEKSRGTDRKDRSELAKTQDPINHDEFYESPISGQSIKKKLHDEKIPTNKLFSDERLETGTKFC